VLDEVTRVREEMGYPIMVTPVSQFVATQATMNVVSGERWRDVSDEIVRYFHGHFFEPAAPVDPEIRDKVLSQPRAAELGKLEPLSLEGASERFGSRISEEELLLRLTMPADQVDAMIAARDEPTAKAAPLARPGRSPVVRLLGELAKRESLSYVRVEKGDDVVVWRRAA
jgi:oxaloacetate decarboxylase alpha subunit